MSKGSARRPAQVGQEELAKRWAETFHGDDVPAPDFTVAAGNIARIEGDEAWAPVVGDEMLRRQGGSRTVDAYDGPIPEAQEDADA